MSNDRVRPFRIIRMALLGGVLAFGAVVFYLSSTGSLLPSSPDLLGTFRLVFLALALGTLGGIAFIRSLQSKASTFEARSSLAIGGWALGEGVALFGGVVYLLTGSGTLYLLGLAILIAALIIVPLPEDA